MIDILAVPKRLEQHVAKPHSHQVLYRLFAQIVVDPVDLAFVEILGQRGVERLRGFQVAAKGLFDDDPALRVRHAPLLQTFRQITEQRGRDREIIGLYPFGPGHELLQLGPAVFPFGVDRDIFQPVDKPVQLRLLVLEVAVEFGNRLADHLLVARPVHFCARGTNDTGVLGHLPCTKAPEQARQDLAARQIACAAENHQIKRIDRNDA